MTRRTLFAAVFAPFLSKPQESKFITFSDIVRDSSPSVLDPIIAEIANQLGYRAAKHIDKLIDAAWDFEKQDWKAA